jgi:hypothetical protein
MSFCICDAEGYAHLCPTQRRQCPICKSYEQGKCEPLYPVPTIPLSVSITYDQVWIAEYLESSENPINVVFVSFSDDVLDVLEW